MNAKKNISGRPGVALLVVLFIVMVITITALGFVSRSDVELSCGQNMILRTEMDYLAESGLEHARGMILNPQDVGTEFWTGDTGLQLASGSDFYDVRVNRDANDFCNYIIDCNAYRMKGIEKIGCSNLQGELRLNPCIVYWQTAKRPIYAEVSINGDIYCGDDLVVEGIVNGDVFAEKSITDSGSITGQKNEFVPTPPISLPGLVYTNFSSQYYYNGSGPYSVQVLSDPNYDSWFPEPGLNNPACVYYHNGDIDLCGDILITGMLVVAHDLRLKQNCNLSIVAIKDFPALLVGHDIKIENDNQSLTVTGLVQVDNHIDMGNKSGSLINIMGALCIGGDGIMNTVGGIVEINSFPDKAALEIWPTVSTAKRWKPAAGAFFKNIKRK